MSIVEFDGAAILVSWYERNWEEYKMPVDRVVEDTARGINR